MTRTVKESSIHPLALLAWLLIRRGETNEKIINDAHAPNPIGSYNQAQLLEGLFLPQVKYLLTLIQVKWLGETLKPELIRFLRILSAILGSADSDLSKVVLFTVFITDMANYQAVNDVFNEWLDEEIAPARSLVSVRQLPANADIEIECIALC